MFSGNFQDPRPNFSVFNIFDIDNGYPTDYLIRSYTAPPPNNKTFFSSTDSSDTETGDDIAHVDSSNVKGCVADLEMTVPTVEQIGSELNLICFQYFMIKYSQKQCSGSGLWI